MPKSRILVIDDEAAIRDSLRMTLEYEGYEFVGAATGQEGLALAERESPDLVLLDVKMPGMDGLEVLDRLRAMNDAVPIIVISGHGTISTALEATKKGAFNGATEKQVGKFEQADRGTIFLDEVGDMSAKTQAKVLRVLQEGEVERLGSARTIKVDVRVIAATNKDLEEEIEKGTFREDLYFRLSVIPIRVPPLRDRREDIPILVKHFADLFSRENNRKPQRVTQAAYEYLQKARWKGNVRELRNTVERLLIMTPGDTIDVDDLREVVRMDAKA